MEKNRKIPIIGKTLSALFQLDVYYLEESLSKHILNLLAHEEGLEQATLENYMRDVYDVLYRMGLFLPTKGIPEDVLAKNPVLQLITELPVTMLSTAVSLYTELVAINQSPYLANDSSNADKDHQIIEEDKKDLKILLFRVIDNLGTPLKQTTALAPARHFTFAKLNDLRSIIVDNSDEHQWIDEYKSYKNQYKAVPKIRRGNQNYPRQEMILSSASKSFDSIMNKHQKNIMIFRKKIAEAIELYVDTISESEDFASAIEEDTFPTTDAYIEDEPQLVAHEPVVQSHLKADTDSQGVISVDDTMQEYLTPAEQHKFYQDQKKQKKSHQRTKSVVATFQEKLARHVNKRIFTNKANFPSWHELEDELKDFNFVVEPNPGKGTGFALRHVATGKWISVHRPKDRKNPIPPSYMHFIQAGFRNVFGIERTDVE